MTILLQRSVTQSLSNSVEERNTQQFSNIFKILGKMPPTWTHFGVFEGTAWSTFTGLCDPSYQFWNAWEFYSQLLQFDAKNKNRNRGQRDGLVDYVLAPPGDDHSSVPRTHVSSLVPATPSLGAYKTQVCMHTPMRVCTKLKTIDVNLQKQK